MKVSLNWLKDYVSIGISAEKLEHKLTMAGLEVEKVFSVEGDTVFEMEVTPNRPDCLSIWGIARELAAILDKKLDLPKIKEIKPARKKCDITIEDKKGCIAYLGTVIKGVQPQEAPPWIQNKLSVLGIRAVNNIVDITNFCLIETGQPLHAFDFDKIEGGKIIVRRAKKGEKIVTIDDVERELDSSVLVIADAKKPIAIAGIMGGKETEVSSLTKNILLESAYFDPLLIRRAARALGISTESSYRFERGVSFSGVEKTSYRATALLLQHAKGSVEESLKNYIDSPERKRREIAVSIKKINDCLGAQLSRSSCSRMLKSLGFEVTTDKKGNIKVFSPDFRRDIREDVDIIEELARIVGYDNLPVSLPCVRANTMETDPRRKMKEQIKRILVEQGFCEIISYSMVNVNMLERMNIEGSKSIKVKNPLTQDQGVMRREMLPSLLNIAALNISRGQKDLKLFEVGKIYESGQEKEIISMIAMGRNGFDWRQGMFQEISFYDVKGAGERIFSRCCGKEIQFEKSGEINGLDVLSGQSAQIKQGKTVVGILGRVDGKVLAAFGVKQKDVYYSEIDLEWIYKHIGEAKTFASPCGFPAVIRDISLAIKEETSYNQIKQVVFGQKIEILRSMNIVEQYLGEKLLKGYRGITFSLTYQSSSRTLTDEEVSNVHEDICKRLVKELKAVQR